MSWTNIFMVPLVMVCALAGTVGLIWLIGRYNSRGSGKEQQQ